MINTALYIGTILIWGSTWLAIQYQVDSVNPVWSVAYRFAIATIILFVYCFAKKLPMKFNKQEHLAILLQSALIFSINYILYYLGSAHLISGYVAILGATIAIINIFNCRLFLNMPLNKKALLGAIIGIAGLVVVFWQEFASIKAGDMAFETLAMAVFFCLLGTYVASLGNIVSKRNQDLNLPIVQTNAWGMLYGTLITASIAAAFRLPMHIDFSFQYLFALLYLSLFGSVIAFGLYLKLLGSIGPDRAAYLFVVTPIVALILSSFFEGFHWESSTIVGILMILAGNTLVMSAPKPAPSA
ncbi:MAG: DMT family transporter [Gammaproteobacteria bacterium]